MKNLKHIKSFVFDYAQYEISDQNGTNGLLKINYKDNNYHVELNANPENSGLKAEAENIAQELLSRKHGVNFANI